jgi:hypothetical protein
MGHSRPVTGLIYLLLPSNVKGFTVTALALDLFRFCNALFVHICYYVCYVESSVWFRFCLLLCGSDG